jgi:hypothetical protein
MKLSSFPQSKRNPFVGYFQSLKIISIVNDLVFRLWMKSQEIIILGREENYPLEREFIKG